MKPFSRRQIKRDVYRKMNQDQPAGQDDSEPLPRWLIAVAVILILAALFVILSK